MDPGPRRSPLDGLLARLAVEWDPAPTEDGVERFVADPGRGEGRLFGGLVAAQATVAAGRTAPGRSLHSLHAYFLRPGRHGEPIRFQVHRIRDGRSFVTRRLVAEQGGSAIFNLSASFCSPEAGIEHQEPMPDAPEPETCVDWEEHRAAALGDPGLRRRDGPVEIRVCDPDDPTPGARQEPRRSVWMRPRGALPEDPLLHAALLVYASDRTLLGTAARPHGLPWGRRMAASLDHALWLHRVPRFDDWILYASESPVAHAARGLVLGGIFRRDGVRLASVAQEGLIRERRDPD